MKFAQPAQLSSLDSPTNFLQKMKNSKEEITISISKKAKIWLSIIICVIFAAVATVVLVSRHYELLSRQSAPTEQDGGGSGDSSGEDSGDSQSGDYIDGVDLENSSLNQILHILDDIGDTGIHKFHTWFGNYFDDSGIVDKAKANLTESRYTQLEAQAASMMQIIQTDFYANAKTVTAETFSSSEDFCDAFPVLKNLLNEAI